MTLTTRRWAAAAAIAALAGSQLLGVPASADPEVDPRTEAQPAPAGTEVLHNVIYRARADGTSRDAVVAYKMDDANVNSATPTMLPGQTFEVNAVLARSQAGGDGGVHRMAVRINLHCEILVDDQIVAQADQFIAPRFFRVKDDPMYGTLQCGAPLDIPNVAPPAPDAATRRPERRAAQAAPPPPAA